MENTEASKAVDGNGQANTIETNSARPKRNLDEATWTSGPVFRDNRSRGGGYGGGFGRGGGGKRPNSSTNSRGFGGSNSDPRFPDTSSRMRRGGNGDSSYKFGFGNMNGGDRLPERNHPRLGGRGGWQNSYNPPDRPSHREQETWATRDGRGPANERESEIFKSTKDKTTGINFDSYDTIDVEVSGRDTNSIQPLASFKTADDMPPPLLENIIRVRYDKPTPVQRYAIPILLANRDLMACAQTGSGKTAAFLFPMIIKMLKEGPPPPHYQARSARPVGLVLSPTRELTVQIYEESRKFAFQTGIRTVVVYGGADIGGQLLDLHRGCDICVATPGRLNDIMERKRISLRNVKYLVLDEADRMLDMGFAPQINQIVTGEDMPDSKSGRQTAMFSATFPREIQQLAETFLNDYIYLTVGRVGSTNDFITQKLIYSEDSDKPYQLLQLLKEAKGRVLIFVETKKKADVIEDFLCSKGLSATSIHGDRTQVERQHALELFKSGSRPILVATDVAARGLDIHSITWVINLDLPHSIEDYVHRIGRTGRAGNAGLATSFVNENNRNLVRELHRLLEEANQEIPNWLLKISQQCSSANTKFGMARYGNRNNNRGGGSFGGVDMRPFEDGLLERRTFNAQTTSPRGGFQRGSMAPLRSSASNRANVQPPRPGGPHHAGAAQQPVVRSTADEDDCW